jgi:hypothetical protein
MKKPNNVCLVPDCGAGVVTRGLCWRHYAKALRLIKKELTSWDKLEKSGKSLPTDHGKKHSDWFLDK